MRLTDLWGKRLLLLDGGMGTQLQLRGLPAGELPELWNLTHPGEVQAIHEGYYAAGSDVVMSNTFGVNALKYPDRVGELVSAGVRLARAAAERYSTPERPRFVGLDLGPTGKLLRPMGDLDFEDCVALYAEVVRAGAAAGADMVAIETMTDGYEAKAAVLAAKENCDLPVYVTITPDAAGKLLSGGDLRAAVVMLEGLRVDMLGLNCGLGPVQLLPMVRELAAFCHTPLAIKPNAGLPVRRGEQTVYDIDAATFSAVMREVAELPGVAAVGGCCGTTPEHIATMAQWCADRAVQPGVAPRHSVIAGYAHALVLGERPVIIGERINPTGKKRFKQALIEGDLDYILGEGLRQQQAGADALDVNVGLPEIDEVAMLPLVTEALQGVTDLPLQLDTASPAALAGALRRYNGKALVNSVCGKAESMAAVLPLVARYGGVVVGLTLDEDGIPATAEGRLAIARRIVDAAAGYGIGREDILIDALTMTVSAEPQSALVTLDSVERVTRELGVGTVLGVSNISFGLPRRELISSTFFAMALQRGLSAAIINPGSAEMMAVYRSYLTLTARDSGCAGYLAAYASSSAVPAADPATAPGLGTAVRQGLRERAVQAAAAMLSAGTAPMELVEQQLIPALDAVGKGFEARTVFLPQLMLSAEAAKAAFAVVSEALSRSGAERKRGAGIALATVKGDIHDIGKNIVKVLLENYGYEVVDLGKDVEPAAVLDAVTTRGLSLVGLSALMTTTVGAMAETIALLRQNAPDCRVMVGGAVLTADYAASIGANYYAADAMAAVRYAKDLFGKGE